jgi:hypothetical protein
MAGPVADAGYGALRDYFRLPERFLDGIAATVDPTPDAAGFFQFGPSNICYGRSRTGVAPRVEDASRFEVAGRRRVRPRPFAALQLLRSHRHLASNTTVRTALVDRNGLRPAVIRKRTT